MVLYYFLKNLLVIGTSVVLYYFLKNLLVIVGCAYINGYSVCYIIGGNSTVKFISNIEF